VTAPWTGPTFPAWGTCCGFRKLCEVPKVPLSASHPELAAQAVGWDPSTVSAGSSKVLPWRCPLGHRYDARVSHRAIDATECPFCTNRRVLSGFNDLATTHPQIAAEADGWDPSTVVPGSAQVRFWRCAQGHSWRARVGVRTGLSLVSGKGTGCPFCLGRLPIIGLNDLATTHPELAAQADGWDPKTVKAAANSIRQWRCLNGHVWKARVFSRALHDRGCPQCWGRVVTPGVNDLATLYPELASELVDADPKTIHHGTKAKHRWRCEEGHEWEAAVNTRTRKLASGCPTCATSGFDPSKPAWLYLLKHEECGLLQVGITNRPEGRISTHGRTGWTLLDITNVEGSTARVEERAILHAVRASGAKQPKKRFDGYSESWSADSYPAWSIADLRERAF
jgi:hypothetical protein